VSYDLYELDREVKLILARGTKKIKYLDENVGAINIELTHEEERKIRAAIEEVEVKGDRYGAVFTSFSLADTPEL